MDGWMDGWLVCEWMDGHLDVWMGFYGYMDGWMDGWVGGLGRLGR